MLGHSCQPAGRISNAAHLLTAWPKSRGERHDPRRDIIRPGPSPGAASTTCSRLARGGGKVVLRLQPVELAETTRRVAALHGGPRAAAT